MIPTTKIFTASKCRHARLWRSYRSLGYNVISTWIDEAGEGESKSLVDLAIRCINEAGTADALILYCEEGEKLKGALLEAGAALARGVPVYYVGPRLDSAFEHHPFWRRVSTVGEAFVKAAEQHR